MKKHLHLVCLILLLISFLVPGSAFAEGISEIKNRNDINTLPIDELVELYKDVLFALAQSKAEYTINLPAGQYEVGKDIPSGLFKMECSGMYSSANVKIYDTAEDSFPSFSQIMAELYNSSIIGKIELKEGNVISISGSIVELSTYNPSVIEIELSEKANDISEKSQANSIMESPAEEKVYSAGRYIVGEDIHAGAYRVELKNTYSTAIVEVYKTQKDKAPYYSQFLGFIMSSAIGKLELEKGNVLSIDNDLLFIPYSPK